MYTPPHKAKCTGSFMGSLLRDQTVGPYRTAFAIRRVYTRHTAHSRAAIARATTRQSMAHITHLPLRLLFALDGSRPGVRHLVFEDEAARPADIRAAGLRTRRHVGRDRRQLHHRIVPREEGPAAHTVQRHR
jgi:hypothetical protein